MDLMEETGLKTLIGKVNMDRNGPDTLQEKSAAASEADTLRWLSDIQGKYENVRPILTPRFTPSCTERSDGTACRSTKAVSSSPSVPPVRKYGRDRLGERALPQHQILRRSL